MAGSADNWHGGALHSGKGWLGQLDARIRVAVAASSAITAVIIHTIPVLILALGLVIIMSASARMPWKRTLKLVMAMDSFIILMLLMLPFTHPGEPLFTVFGLTGSVEGTYQAVRIGLKANIIMLTLITLVGTLDPVTLGQALRQLRVPDKLTQLLLFTVRYIDVLHREFGRLRLAMRARAFTPRANMHTWRSLAYLFGMLLVRSHDRSERVLAAMKCRGYDGRFILKDTPPIQRFDIAFSLGTVVVLGCLIAGELLL